MTKLEKTIPLEILQDHSIIAWIEYNEIKNEKGERITFHDYPYLYDIYRDQSQYLVVIKCAQCGLSTCEVLKNHYDAKHRNMAIIYTLPTDAEVKTFVGGKVNPIIANNPCMLADVADKDSIEMKKVGGSMIYFRGTWTEKAAIMITADRLVHDEKDTSKQSVVEDFKARLDGQNSLKQRHVFSHPSVKNSGVDVEWNESNQREWIVKCPHCTKRQFLEWSMANPRRMSVDIEKEIYACKYCHGELSDEDRRRGRWKPRKGREDQEYSGYHISQLMAPRISAKEICKKWKLVVDGKQTEEYFYNKVLGLAYAGSDATISEAVVLGSITKKENPMDKRIVIGVDSGIKLRFVMGNLYGVIGYGEFDDWEPRKAKDGDPRPEVLEKDTIEGLLIRYPESVMVIDAGGDILGPRKLQEKYPGRIFLCSYRKDRKTQQLITWGKAEEDGIVTVDRNRMISMMVGEYKDGRVKLYNGTAEDYWAYWEHWSHIKRTTEEDKTTQKPQYVWVRTDRDDWVHAHLYYRVGLDQFGELAAIDGVMPESKANTYEVNPDGTVDIDTEEFFNLVFDEEPDWRD